jgi:hypothetical protein
VSRAVGCGPPWQFFAPFGGEFCWDRLAAPKSWEGTDQQRNRKEAHKKQTSNIFFFYTPPLIIIIIIIIITMPFQTTTARFFWLAVAVTAQEVRSFLGPNLRRHTFSLTTVPPFSPLSLSLVPPDIRPG